MAKEYGTPGPRAIYPEICDSRSLSRCGILASALWPRLIAKADDQGRLAGDAADILGLAFPKMLDKVTVRQVQVALVELEAQHQLRRYVVAGEPFIQLLTWWSWQHNQRRAYPSRHPAPDGWTDVVYGYDAHPKTFREAGGLAPHVRTLPTSSPHAADFESAPRPQDADTVPSPAGAPARSRASAVPDPTRPDPTVPDSPPTPAERGPGEETPRESGANPRAKGTSPRQQTREEEMAKRARASRRQQAYLRHLITAEQLDLMNQTDAPLSSLPTWEDPEPTPIGTWFDAKGPEVLRPVDPEAIARRRSQAIETIRIGGLSDAVIADLRSTYGITDADLAGVTA